jgi:hypothetical protein
MQAKVGEAPTEPVWNISEFSADETSLREMEAA